MPGNVKRNLSILRGKQKPTQEILINNVQIHVNVVNLVNVEVKWQGVLHVMQVLHHVLMCDSQVPRCTACTAAGW